MKQQFLENEKQERNGEKLGGAVAEVTDGHLCEDLSDRSLRPVSLPTLGWGLVGGHAVSFVTCMQQCCGQQLSILRCQLCRERGGHALRRIKEADLCSCTKEQLLCVKAESWGWPKQSGPQSSRASLCDVVATSRVQLLKLSKKRKKSFSQSGICICDVQYPLEEDMATHSSILAWRIPWTEEPGRLQSLRSHRVRHD